MLMAKKKSQLDKAIAALEAEKAVLELALAKLKAQREPKTLDSWQAKTPAGPKGA
jgi:hypothetical protein